MEPNLLYWKSQGQSFVSRLKIWFNLLDPTSLLCSDVEIQKAHARVGRGGKLNEKDGNALNLSLSSVHADSGAVLPLVFRPPAALAFFNVFTVRSEESETGIQVFDSNGNLVGISKAAGEKAVRETALSRAALFGTTAAVPSLLVSLLQRTRLFQRNSLLVAPLRHISVAFVLGLMIPVSFSLFPQLGTIKKENVEEELQAAAVDGQLFYHRGL
eukprot:superscaffoldBa00000911_g7947